MNLAPQQKRLLKHLKQHKSINPLEAWEKLGIYRLSAVIFKLREHFEIKTEVQNSLNKFQEKVQFAKYIFKGAKSDSSNIETRETTS